MLHTVINYVTINLCTLCFLVYFLTTDVFSCTSFKCLVKRVTPFSERKSSHSYPQLTNKHYTYCTSVSVVWQCSPTPPQVQHPWGCHQSQLCIGPHFSGSGAGQHIGIASLPSQSLKACTPMEGNAWVWLLATYNQVSTSIKFYQYWPQA